MPRQSSQPRQARKDHSHQDVAQTDQHGANLEGEVRLGHLSCLRTCHPSEHHADENRQGERHDIQHSLLYNLECHNFRDWFHLFAADAVMGRAQFAG